MNVRNMEVNITERFEAMRELRAAQYWYEKAATRREAAILKARKAGATQRQIAKAAGISDHTVRRHYDKLVEV